MSVWTVVPSPVGELLLTTDGSALTGLRLDATVGTEPGPADTSGTRARSGAAPGRAAGRAPLRLRPDRREDEHPVLRAAVRQLVEYFERRRREFDLPLAPSGTAFQLRVWEALRGIPYGTTVSYGEIARRLGLLPSASRAVGLANGANPIPVVVPCHRVVGADGSLTGYGGGLDRKRFLLDLESDALF